MEDIKKKEGERFKTRKSGAGVSRPGPLKGTGKNHSARCSPLAAERGRLEKNHPQNRLFKTPTQVLWDTSVHLHKKRVSHPKDRIRNLKKKTSAKGRDLRLDREQKTRDLFFFQGLCTQKE